MPLKRGKKNIGKNIQELMKGKIGSAREKAIRTIMKKHGMTAKQAREYQAKAIAMEMARKK